MEEVVRAIEELAKKTYIDYLLLVIPILISLVAVFISIATARKQNRIALFEMRYKALLQINTVLDFEKIIYAENSNKLIINAFDFIYGTDISFQDDMVAMMKTSQQINKISQDIGPLKFLVSQEHQHIFDELINNLSNIMADAIDGSINAEAKENLHSVCDVFKCEIYEKITNKIKI